MKISSSFHFTLVGKIRSHEKLCEENELRR
jgi:hypothetical protein